MRLDSLVAVLGVWNPLEKLTSQLNLTEVVKDAAASMFATAAQLIIGMSLTVLEKVFLYIDSTTDFNIGTSTDTGAPTALARILPYTLWLGLTVAVIMAFWTLMSAGMRRDARQLGQLAVGIAQYAIVVAAFLAVFQQLNEVCDASSSFFLSQISPGDDKGLASPWLSSLGNPEQRPGVDVLEAVGVMFVSAFFALMSLFFGVILYIELAMREVAILVLMATAPIAAAGLLRGSTVSWFKKLCMWTVSLLLMKPAASLILWVSTVFLTNPQGLTGIIGGMACGRMTWIQVCRPVRFVAFAASHWPRGTFSMPAR